MFIKYPRTEHLTGSKLLDLGLDFSHFKNSEQTEFKDLNHTIIVEEKMDGIGLGIGFNEGVSYIQHRGHIYNLNEHALPFYLKSFVQWFLQYEELFYTLLEDQYVLFGEWLQYTHTVFYDQLPSLFMEYDIYDKREGYFLSTNKRQLILQDYQQEIVSVSILQKSQSLTLGNIEQLLKSSTTSIGKTSQWKFFLEQQCQHNSINFNEFLNFILNDCLYEGFYIKTETSDRVTGRYKWIRKSFMDKILSSEHWKHREVIKNLTIKY